MNQRSGWRRRAFGSSDRAIMTWPNVLTYKVLWAILIRASARQMFQFITKYRYICSKSIGHDAPMASFSCHSQYIWRDISPLAPPPRPSSFYPFRKTTKPRLHYIYYNVWYKEYRHDCHPAASGYQRHWNHARRRVAWQARHPLQWG